jgi:hypothetical protein
MPIQIIQTKFSDNFGTASENTYNSNVGDQFSMVIDIQETIRMNSITNPMFLDLSMAPYSINSSSLSWIDEGFRLGDTVTIQIFNPLSTTPFSSHTATVQYVDDVTLGVNSILAWYDLSLNQYAVVTVSSRSRADLEVQFNHVLNSTAGTPFSLIDGEASRVVLNNLQLLPVLGNQNGILIGNQSGQFLIGCRIIRNADSFAFERSYQLILTFVNSGLYDSAWFQSSDCLKTYAKLLFSSLPGEVDSRSEIVISPAGNTGYFNEARNINSINSTLIQGITEIDYCIASTHEVVVDGPLPKIGLGAAYISIDETYYKNQTFSQNKLAICLPSYDIVAFPIKNSEQNQFLAQYEIEIISIVTVGTVHTINFTFTPNNEFNLFFAGREDGDRLFQLWVKCGNVNLLAFSDQLTCTPPVGDPLIMVDEKAFFDHSENIIVPVDNTDQLEFNIEDDFAYAGSFLLEKSKIYEVFRAKIQVFNSVTLEAFTLLELSFDFGPVLISNDGRYLLNEVATVITTLPNTSLKRVAKLYLNPALDTLTEYGVSIYFPALLRWEYWLPQLNANIDFYPNQNRNWYGYETLPDWNVQMKLTLIESGLSHDYSKDIVIKDYDSEPLIVQQIQLVIDSTNQNVDIVVEGQMMRVIAEHSLLNGQFWDNTTTWGMITVEPTESNPRFISSTVIDYDFNSANPLIPLTGEMKCKLTFPTPTLARLECFFNPNLINLTNGIKFTTKIKGCSKLPVFYKITTNGDKKITTNNNFKIIA